jgi:peptidyl-Lys metalloendopeptidase
LKAGTQGSRYTTWFGIFDISRYSTVTTHFASIDNAMDTAPVMFDCGCKKKYYAYVYPTRPYAIYLCKVFWTAPMTGTDSKAGTLIHEMSHFNGLQLALSPLL